MDALISWALLCLTSFFALIDPLASMPIFMTLTGQLDREHRNRVALRAVLVAFGVLLMFAIFGQLLFTVFGVSVDGLRIVGGVIFFKMGLDMLQARLSPMDVEPGELKAAVKDLAVTPLAIPVLCGPGAITNAMVLMEDAVSIYQQLILIFSVVLVLLLTLVIFRSAGHIHRLLGQTGNNLMLRLMGLIVMLIAVEFFFAGLTPYVSAMRA